jgi:hypothetical protein
VGGLVPAAAQTEGHTNSIAWTSLQYCCC